VKCSIDLGITASRNGNAALQSTIFAAVTELHFIIAADTELQDLQYCSPQEMQNADMQHLITPVTTAF
jgi:hypothetical protein